MQMNEVTALEAAVKVNHEEHQTQAMLPSCLVPRRSSFLTGAFSHRTTSATLRLIPASHAVAVTSD